MNERSSFHGLILLALFLIPYPLMACTAFTIKNDTQVFLAKNLDWAINDGIIVLNKRGLFKTAYNQQLNKLAWTAKYGSLPFNQFGKEFPLGGMNEMGLVIEELNSWGEAPKEDHKYRRHDLGKVSKAAFLNLARFGKAINCK